MLLSSAVLLSTWNPGGTLHLAKCQPVTENPVFTNSLATVAARTLNIPGYKANRSEIHDSPVLTKRAPTLTYTVAVCKGRKLYNELILPAFEGSSTPGTEFGEKDINNGWTREPMSRRIPLGFEEAFKSIGKNVFPSIGERLPTLDEIKVINLVQDKDFKTFQGKKQKVRPKPPTANTPSHLWNPPFPLGNPRQRQPPRPLRMLLRPSLPRHHFLRHPLPEIHAFRLQPVPRGP